MRKITVDKMNTILIYVHCASNEPSQTLPW